MFDRRDVMRGAVALGLLGGRSARAMMPEGRHLIVVFAYGGWDTTFVFDPKLSVPGIEGPEVDESPNDPDDVEAVQTFSGIPIGVNEVKRPAVTEFFTNWGSRSAVVNGIEVASVAHSACTVRMLTGTRVETSPDIATIAGFSLGVERPIPHMNLGASGFSGPLAAYTGRAGRSSQLKALIDRQTPLGESPTFVADGEGATAIRAFIEARRSRLTPGTSTRRQALMVGYGESIERARLLASDTDFADAMTLGRRPTLALNARMPVDLLAGGLTSSLAIDSGSSWDSHLDNRDQHEAFDTLFVGLDHLMTELQSAGLLESTTVAVLSEMGRTPVRNSSGGKDHWPTTSALLMGAGVAGGRVVGGTDDNLDSLEVDLSTGLPADGGMRIGYDSLAAGILELVGVDPALWHPGVVPFRGLVA